MNINKLQLKQEMVNHTKGYLRTLEEMTYIYRFQNIVKTAVYWQLFVKLYSLSILQTCSNSVFFRFLSANLFFSLRENVFIFIFVTHLIVTIWWLFICDIFTVCCFRSVATLLWSQIVSVLLAGSWTRGRIILNTTIIVCSGW